MHLFVYKSYAIKLPHCEVNISYGETKHSINYSRRQPRDIPYQMSRDYIVYKNMNLWNHLYRRRGQRDGYYATSKPMLEAWSYFIYITKSLVAIIYFFDMIY